jgi:arginase
MTRTISVLGAPTSAGAYAPGQEKAPAAFRRHGLVERLRGAGREVRDRGDAGGIRWRPDPAMPKAMNLGAVVGTAAGIADRVAAALEADEACLVLGGDCTVELGVVAGALRGAASVGLLYIDLDVDLTPPEESDGALDWTGVVHLLGLEGARRELAGLGPRSPLLAPADILYLGVDNLEGREPERFASLGMQAIRLAEVKADAARAGARAAAWGARFERLLVHLDVDVLSYVDFPIAENVRRRPGLVLEELAAALAPVVRAEGWRALTICEVNPDHAPDEAEAFARLSGVLAGVLKA